MLGLTTASSLGASADVSSFDIASLIDAWVVVGRGKPSYDANAKRHVLVCSELCGSPLMTHVHVSCP